MSPADRADGPVLIAYDGSDHAMAAIEEAGRQLRTDRPAVVLAVWEPLESIPFWGAPVAMVPSQIVDEAREEARKTAEEGVELARKAGFDAEALVQRGTPVWEAIVAVANEQDASVIVIGSHGRSGVSYAALGSVATAVAHHSRRSVLITSLAN
jgi:nucleotide-binding universal stress UspA family protein